MIPSVKILYSESNDAALQPGAVMSLGNANSYFEQRDYECIDANTIENVVYKVSYFVGNEERTCLCSQYLGEGDGSIINHLRKTTLGFLEALNETATPSIGSGSTRNPFTSMRTSSQNMLNIVLPHLEAYCLAFKTVDVLSAFQVDNCDDRLSGDFLLLTELVKQEPAVFLELLDDVCRKNPDNISLLSSVEILVEKTEHFITLNGPGHTNQELVDVLKKASARSAVINQDSVLNIEPPPEKEFYD